MTCEKCGYEQEIVEETPNKPHFAKRICGRCENFLGWQQKPENRGKRTKTSKYSIKDIVEFHGYNEAFCFHCLRKEDELGENEKIQKDHIKELQNDGEDRLENLQLLCSACHSRKNWARLYMNWHQSGGKNE